MVCGGVCSCELVVCVCVRTCVHASARACVCVAVARCKYLLNQIYGSISMSHLWINVIISVDVQAVSGSHHLHPTHDFYCYYFGGTQTGPTLGYKPVEVQVDTWTSFIKKLMSRLVELARRSVTRTTAAIKAEQVASSAFCHEHACAVFTSAHH